MTIDGGGDPVGEGLRFQRSLAAKRMGAGAVIRDDAGRVLVVKPTYKEPWELPGGAVEEGESPAAACRRELREELALDVEVGELVCVDYNSPAPDYIESLMFLFEVRCLTAGDLAAIRIETSEISEWRFCDPAEAGDLLGARVGRRLAAVLDDGRLRTGLYLEDQEPATGGTARDRPGNGR